jgi:nicotinamide riboside kinase
LENHGSVADKYLFCDTNLMVTKVFRVYYNYCDPALDKAAQEHEYVCFLTDIDVPWEKMI